jgi:hypothetical protein
VAPSTRESRHRASGQQFAASQPTLDLPIQAGSRFCGLARRIAIVYRHARFAPDGRGSGCRLRPVQDLPASRRANRQQPPGHVRGGARRLQCERGFTRGASNPRPTSCRTTCVGRPGRRATTICGVQILRHRFCSHLAETNRATPVPNSPSPEEVRRVTTTSVPYPIENEPLRPARPRVCGQGCRAAAADSRQPVLNITKPS